MTNGMILGNKLFELRKQKGLSQEELADKLGVSRQAVSKWECGESLPDTDNLISISKLYGVSLDELVGNMPSKSAVEKELVTVEKLKQDILEELDEDEKEDAEAEAYYSHDGTPADKKRKVLRFLHTLPYPIIVTVAFLLWGCLADGWGIAWTLYITIPVYYTILECIRLKRWSAFAYPVFVAFIYCFIGMQWDGWHPWWVLFITVPIYYVIAGLLDRK